LLAVTAATHTEVLAPEGNRAALKGR
jgi:hypothetical protein